MNLKNLLQSQRLNWNIYILRDHIENTRTRLYQLSRLIWRFNASHMKVLLNKSSNPSIASLIHFLVAASIAIRLKGPRCCVEDSPSCAGDILATILASVARGIVQGHVLVSMIKISVVVVHLRKGPTYPIQSSEWNINIGYLWRNHISCSNLEHEVWLSVNFCRCGFIHSFTRACQFYK